MGHHTEVPLSLRFPWPGFCRVNFHFFDTNFCFNPKSRHYATLATPRVQSVGKFVPLASVTLPVDASGTFGNLNKYKHL